MTVIEGGSFKNQPSRIVVRCDISNALKLIQSKWVKFNYLHILGDFPVEKLDVYYQIHEEINLKDIEQGDLVLINKIDDSNLNLFRFAYKLGITVIVMANVLENINKYLEIADIYLCDSSNGSDLSMFGLKRVFDNMILPKIFMINTMENNNLLITTPFSDYHLFIDSNFQKGILVIPNILKKYYSVITSEDKIICFDKEFKLKKTNSKLYMFTGLNFIELIKKMNIDHTPFLQRSRPYCLHTHYTNYLRSYKFCDFCGLPKCHQHLQSICSNCI